MKREIEFVDTSYRDMEDDAWEEFKTFRTYDVNSEYIVTYDPEISRFEIYKLL